MVVIPAGSFMMGSPPNEEHRKNYEGPQHRVTVPEAFAVGKYEVTFDEWNACVSAGGCEGYRPEDNVWGRGRHPVIHVSWSDAKTYVEWLSGWTGETYHLLSEAEWEYAARAGTTTPFSTGWTIGPYQANFRGGKTLPVRGGKALPVGSFPPNGFGLHDLHGNVWEWVEDCWHGSYAFAPSDGSAWTSVGDCEWRVLRGGSWDDEPRAHRSAFRLGYESGMALPDGATVCDRPDHGCLIEYGNGRRMAAVNALRDIGIKSPSRWKLYY